MGIDHPVGFGFDPDPHCGGTFPDLPVTRAYLGPSCGYCSGQLHPELFASGPRGRDPHAHDWVIYRMGGEHL